MAYKLAVMMAVVSLLVALPTAGWADLSLGSLARQTAMGGAGIALTDDPLTDAAKNPAALAYGGGFNFRWPNLEFRGRGAAGLGDVLDNIGQLSDMSVEDALDLAGQFATEGATLQLNVETGFGTSAMDISANGAGQGRITPDTPTAEELGLGYEGAARVQGGAIYAFPSVAMARRMESGAGEQSNLVLGVRVNWLHSISIDQRVLYDADTSEWSALSAASPDKDSDWSADVGLIYELKEPIGAKVALVATDIRKPDLPGLNVETVVHAGFAMTLPMGLVVAGDVRNLTEAYGEKRTAHAGAEWKVGPLAFRAGTSSQGSGWSTGIGIKQFNLSFSPKSAFDAATTIFF